MKSLSTLRNSLCAVFLISTLAACAPPSISLMAGDAALQRNDYAGAIEVFLPAALNSDPEAAYKLGQVYKLIAFSATDAVSAEFKNEATSDPQADASLKYLRTRYKVPLTGSFQKAAEHWLSFAADKKHPLAAFELAQMLMARSSVADKKRAVLLYEFAATKGVVGTAYELGLIYLEGLKAGEASVIQSDVKKAAHFFEMAVKENDFDASYRLALLLRAGLGVTKDEKRAAELMKLAASKGHARARMELVEMYLTGVGGSKNEKEAFILLKKLADTEKDNSWAALRLARCYEEGNGTAINDGEALFWFLKAANAGDAEATFRYGLKLVLGEGDKRNVSKGLKNILIAEEKKSQITDLKLLKSFEDLLVFMRLPFRQKNEKDPLTSVEVSSFQAQAELGDALAQFKLGQALENGDGIKEDLPKAFYWHEKSATQGNLEAMISLGSMYRNGKGTTKDYAKALIWFKRAADKGHASAQTKLGVLYDFGYGVERNQKLAADWYRKAADQGHAPAQYNLASMYLKGEGIDKDVAQAVEWLEKAAAQNEISAITRLAQLDTPKAAAWLEKAAEWGVPAAIDKLAALLIKGEGIEKDRNKAAQWLVREEYDKRSWHADKDAKFMLSKKEVDDFIAHPETFFTSIRVIPHIVDGQAAGLRILSIKESSFLQKIGVKRGDIVQKVDDFPVDLHTSFKIIDAIKSHDNPHTIAILRQGESRILEINIE